MRKQHHRLHVRRRHLLLAGLGAPWAAARAQAAWRVQAVAMPEPIVQVRAAETAGWLAVGEGGGLWWLRGASSPVKLASAIDARMPVSAAHGRVVARRGDGRLWIGEAGREAVSAAAVAPHAGVAVLPLGIIAVQGDGLQARLVRWEPDARGAWRASARSGEAVLPDARPIQVDLDGGGDAGHIAVLAGPDDKRYAHGVLGDGIEATRVLYLERHDLTVLRELTLAAPHVFEDNRLRVWAASLVAVRSGPQGAQLALIEVDRTKAMALRIAALGEPIGSANRWMSPSSDGQHLVSVHTPHLSAALHAVAREGGRLLSSPLAQGVSNHTIGAHELDVAAWLGSRYVLADLPSRRVLRGFDIATRRELPPLDLPAPLRAISADAERKALAVVLADGSLRTLAI
jgi:hypothetical protein